MSLKLLQHFENELIHSVVIDTSLFKHPSGLLIFRGWTPLCKHFFCLKIDFAEFFWAYVKLNLKNILFLPFYDWCLSYLDNPQFVTFIYLFSLNSIERSLKQFTLEQKKKKLQNVWSSPNNLVMANFFILSFVSLAFASFVSTSNIPGKANCSYLERKKEKIVFKNKNELSIWC